MNTSEVRRSILEDHTRIRKLLDEIEALIASFVDGGSVADGDHLRVLGIGLYETLAEHLALEDKVLVPILRTSGPDGLAHARQLGHEHRVQRELLEFLTDRLCGDDLPTVLVVRQLQNFAEYLRFDMTHEEEVVLAG